MGKRPCHYCGTMGNTRDHIVARYWYNPKKIPQEVAEANKVPACARCNGYKSHLRSDCDCDICEFAWQVMAPYILPRKKHDIPIVHVQSIMRGA